jgi:hypothetical protein
VAVSSLIGEVLIFMLLGAGRDVFVEISAGGWLFGFAFMAVLNAVGLLVVGLPVAFQLRRRGYTGGTALGWLAAVGMAGGGLMAVPFLAGADPRSIPMAILIGAGFGLIAALVWAMLNISEFDRAPAAAAASEGGDG